MKNIITTAFLILTTAILLTAQSSLPSVNIKTLDGKTVNINEFSNNGKITVVSFWATWCTPCKKELDAYAKKYEKWQEEFDMEIVAVTVDDQRALPRVKPLVAEKRWKFTILSDVKQDFQQAMSVQTIPHTYVVDKQGKIVYSHNGYLAGDEKKLEEKLRDLAKG